MTTSSQNQHGPSLSQVNHYGRLIVKYGVVALVVLMVGRVLLTSIVNYWKATHPDPPPAPTVGFGRLPKIEFPEQESSAKPSSYTLELASAKFPEITDRAKVFFMPNPAPSLLADQDVRKKASDLNFIFEPEVLGERTYRFSKSEPLEMNLTIDSLNYNFSLRSNYMSKVELLMNKSLPEEYEAVAKVKSLLDRVDLLAGDVATASGKVSFLKSLGGELIEAVSLSNADFVRVDLNRVPIDEEYEMYGPEGEKGLISAVLTGNISDYGGIVEMDYNYHSVEYAQVETYPLRDTKAAWKVLQANEGYIADKGETDEAIIRQVELGYFDSKEEQEFLQPIYVFKGDGGFIGYVSAIDPQYTVITE